MKLTLSLQFFLLSAAMALPMAAQTITVSSATPNSAAQGSVNLNVTIAGKGFKNGARSQFFVTGTTNPGGIAVNSMAFVSSTQLAANITVSDTAIISGFDILVDNPDGHTGKGSDSFSVTASTSSASTKCSPGPLPAGVTLLGTLNPMTGTPLYTSTFGKTVRARLTTVLGRSVIMTVAGSGNNKVDVFFIDPVSGAVLDGTFGQNHLTMATPEPSYYSMVIADVNGDGIPDLLLGARDYGVAWVYLGQGGGASAFSFSSYYLLTPPAPNSGYGASLAVGNLDGGSVNTIALGLTPTGSGRNFAPGKVFLFKYNGSGFSNTMVLPDPQNVATSGFGGSVAIGDVTGDSLPDLVVGANGNNRAWVYSGTNLANRFYLTSGSGLDGFGTAVAVANLTGAAGGLNDLFVAYSPGSATPEALIYAGPVTAGSGSVLTLQPVSMTWPNAALDFGDLDGDGISDVATGSEKVGCSGSALFYFSSPGKGSYQIAGPLSNSSLAGFGSSIGIAAGTNIVFVGDRYWTGPSGIQSGQIYVFSVH